MTVPTPDPDVPILGTKDLDTEFGHWYMRLKIRLHRSADLEKLYKLEETYEALSNRHRELESWANGIRSSGVAFSDGPNNFPVTMVRIEGSKRGDAPTIKLGEVIFQASKRESKVETWSTVFAADDAFRALPLHRRIVGFRERRRIRAALTELLFPPPA